MPCLADETETLPGQGLGKILFQQLDDPIQRGLPTLVRLRLGSLMLVDKVDRHAERVEVASGTPSFTPCCRV